MEYYVPVLTVHVQTYLSSNLSSTGPDDHMDSKTIFNSLTFQALIILQDLTSKYQAQLGYLYTLISFGQKLFQLW